MAHFAETNPANSETTHITTGASTTVATVLYSRRQYRLGIQALGFGYRTFSRHNLP
jgi:hypothetical protein